MPQLKTRLPKGNHKISKARGRFSKKLKAKYKLPTGKHKVIKDIEELSKTPKDNSNKVLAKTSETSCIKKNEPQIESNIYDTLHRLPTKKKKILLNTSKESSDDKNKESSSDKIKESSDNSKFSENNSQIQNIESALTSKTHTDNVCQLPPKETINNANINTNIDNKTRKRRKPFAHINETPDNSLSPIVLLERLSTEKIKQSIFTNEQVPDKLSCSKDIDNNLSTPINENISPRKRRKKIFHRSCTRRKSQENSENDTSLTCNEKDSSIQSVISDVLDIKKKDKTYVNLEKNSVEKNIYKSASNKDKNSEKVKLLDKRALNKDKNSEKIKLLENEQSENNEKKDHSDSKNNLNTNTSKSEKCGNKFQNETNSKISEIEKKEASVSRISRKTSLRQKNQNAQVSMNASASVNNSNNESEGGIRQNEHKKENCLTECTSERIQKTVISEKKKNVNTNEKCANESVNDKRKTKPENKEDQCELKNEEFLKDCIGKKMANKLEGKKGQNASVTEKSLKGKSEPINKKNKNKSIGKKVENTRNKNKLANKNINEKGENEDQSEDKSSQQDNLKNEKVLKETIRVKRRRRTENKECQSELKNGNVDLQKCIGEKNENELQNEKGLNSPIAKRSRKKYKREKNQNKNADKNIEHTSVSARNINEIVNEKNLIEKGKNKSKNRTDNEDQSESKSSQDKLENEKCLNASVSKTSKNESGNVEEQNKLQNENCQSTTECKNSQVEQNFNKILNRRKMISTQESTTLLANTIKSEVESDDADSSEEHDILNIKIFEMDNQININEEDLVLPQFKESMRVESEPLKNNEVVNVKIFQIDKTVSIENGSELSYLRETLNEQHEVEISATNSKLIEKKMKNTEEENLIDTLEKKNQTEKDKIGADKIIISDQLTVRKSKDTEEKSVCFKENETLAIENDSLKNKAVIKVKIVKFDKPLEIEDCFNQNSDSKTSNDGIEEEKVTSALSNLLDNDKLIDTSEKALIHSPAKSISKTVKKKIETDKIASSNELSENQSKSAEEKTLIDSCVNSVSKTMENKFEFDNTLNCNELSYDKLEEIREKTLTCAKTYDQAKNLFEKMEVENETFINNDIVKIKIFDIDKTLNVEDYFSESSIENTLKSKVESTNISSNIEISKDKLKYTEEKILINSGEKGDNKIVENKNEAEKTTIINELNNIKLKDTKEKAFTNSGTEGANTTINDNKEQKVTESRKKRFIKNIQNKIKALRTTSSKELNNGESESTEEKALTDFSSNIAKKVGKDKIETEESTKNSSDSNKEKSNTLKEILFVINSCEIEISNTVEDETEIEKNESSTESSAVKQKTTKEKVLIDSKVKCDSKIVKNKIEAETTKFSNELSNTELSDEKLKASKEKTLIDSSLKIICNTEKGKIEAEKSVKSTVLRKGKSVDNEDKVATDSCTKIASKSVQYKTVTEKTDNSNNLSEVQSSVTDKKSLIDSLKSVNEIAKNKIESERSKTSNAVSDEKLKNAKEKSSEKSVDKTVKDKIEGEKTMKSKLSDINKKIQPDSCIKTVDKTIKDKIENLKENKKLNNIKEKVIIKNGTNTVGNTVQRNIEEEKNTKNNELSSNKSRAIDKKFLVVSCEKSISKTMKDKIENKKTPENDELSQDKADDTNEKTLPDSCTKSGSTTKSDKTKVKKTVIDSNLQNKKVIDTREKVAIKNCVDTVNKTVKKKIAEDKTTSSNESNDVELRSVNEKSEIDSCEKSVNKTVKDKIESTKTIIDNDFQKKKLNESKEKVDIGNCTDTVSKTVKKKITEDKTTNSNESNDVESKSINEKSEIDSREKSVNKSVKDKIESTKTIINNDFQKKKLNESKEKVDIGNCTDTVSKTVKKKIAEDKTTSSNESNNVNSRSVNEKSEIDSCEKSINNTVKDKTESTKTIIDNDFQKKKLNETKEKVDIENCTDTVRKTVKKKIAEDKTTSSNKSNDVESKSVKEKSEIDSREKSVNKTVEDKIESTKSIFDNDFQKKKLNESKEKVDIGNCIDTVSKTVKKKIEEEKTASSFESNKVKSSITNKKSVIDSNNEKAVSITVNDEIENEKSAENDILSKDKADDANERTLPGSCVKNASTTKTNKTEVEKAVIDSDLQNKKLNNINEKVLVDSSEKIVSVNAKDKIETEKTSISNDVGNEKLTNTKKKLLDSERNANKIIKYKTESQKNTSSKELSVGKSKDPEEKSLIDFCTKNVSKSLSNIIEEKAATVSEVSREKSKEAEKKSLTDSCIKSHEINVIDKIKTSKTKSSNELSKKLQNTEKNTLLDSSTEIDVPERNICLKENEIEVERQEELLTQTNNSVSICTLNSISIGSKSVKNKVKKKKPNKYRRLKKHMIRKKQKKKNSLKICSNEIKKDNSHKIKELIGTICRKNIQDKSKCSEEIVKTSKVKHGTLPLDFESGHRKKRIYRNPITGKFCSKVAAKTSLNKSVPAKIVSNASAPNNLISTSNTNLLSSPANNSIRSHCKTSDTRTSTISNNQASNSKGKDHFLDQNCTSTQMQENVVQDEITIEEHEIKIEEDPQVFEIILSEEEEDPHNINYVTASEIFSGIDSTETNTSKAAFLKNLNLQPPNKGSSVLRTNCINVNNERNTVRERNKVMDVSGTPNRNHHRYTEQPSTSRAFLPSHHLANRNSSHIISDDSSSDELYNNGRRNNCRSLHMNRNSFNDTVASTSANSSNTMGISVREAFEKISLDLLGGYDSQSEIDHQGYSNGINELLHISDSDDEQMNENNIDFEYNDNQSVSNQHNDDPFLENSNVEIDNNSSVFCQKPVKKKGKYTQTALDETMHMMLQCPRCFAECLGMQRLQRHYSRCGVPAMFTCTICQTKLKQKRSLAGHYLSYHGELVDEDTLQDVITETVRRSHEARNKVLDSNYIKMPSHLKVFCDKCQTCYGSVPESHKAACRRCLQPLTYYCEKCTRRQVLSLRVQVHVQSKCTERPSCPHCQHVAETSILLHEHVMKHHAEEPPEILTPCQYGCGLSFIQRQSLQRHEAHCAKEKDQLCKFCPFKTKYRSVIKVHMQKHMINNDVPPVRNTTTQNKKSDEIAMLIEAYCQLCRGVFETAVAGGTRCTRCHSGALYRCRGCGTTETVYREMRRHVSHIHMPHVHTRGRPPTSNRSCRRCGESFADAAGLRRHQRMTGRCRPYCRRCCKTFLNADGLKRHLKVSCGVEPRLRCDHCKFVTKNRFSLVRHMQAQHAEVYNGTRVSCSACGMFFNNIYLFENHAKCCTAMAYSAKKRAP